MRELPLHELEAVVGGFSDVTTGSGRVDVTTYGPYDHGQADRAGIEAARDYFAANPGEDYVDLGVQWQDGNGVDWRTNGGWTRESQSMDLSDVGSERPVQGGFDDDNGEGGGSAGAFG
jgi:hypothetical protein